MALKVPIASCSLEFESWAGGGQGINTCPELSDVFVKAGYCYV